MNQYILVFSDLSLEELQEKLSECKMKLLHMEAIDNLEDLNNRIEALKFLINNFESNE